MTANLINPNKIPHRMTTTTFTFDGYHIVETLGVVMGVTVRSRSVFGSFGAAMETLFGGRIRRFAELCERARSEAFELMMQQAEQHGANAVVGVRYDANEIMQGVTEVLCYGTGVVVEVDG